MAASAAELVVRVQHQTAPAVVLPDKCAAATANAFKAIFQTAARVQKIFNVQTATVMAASAAELVAVAVFVQTV
jgi:hypothetical protein